MFYSKLLFKTGRSKCLKICKIAAATEQCLFKMPFFICSRGQCLCKMHFVPPTMCCAPEKIRLNPTSFIWWRVKTHLKPTSVSLGRKKTCLKPTSVTWGSNKTRLKASPAAEDEKKCVWNQLLSPEGGLKSVSYAFLCFENPPTVRFTA